MANFYFITSFLYDLPNPLVLIFFHRYPNDSNITLQIFSDGTQRFLPPNLV